MNNQPIEIAPYQSIADRAGVQQELDDIFFEASLIRSFESEKERAAFRWRWLGRYLEAGPKHAFVAIGPDGRVAGYIVGSLADPARPLDPELPFYAQFADQTCIYPAHLHINLAPAFRNRGLGGRLIAAFGANAAHRGAPGMHLVTARDARNMSFYARCGFDEVASTVVKGRELVMMAKRLPMRPPVPLRT